MVSDSVRRLVLVVIVMIFESNGLQVSINAAIDVLAQQQRSAAGSRSHARLDQRAAVVCDPCLRSAGTSAKKGSSALSPALTSNTPPEFLSWRYSG